MTIESAWYREWRDNLETSRLFFPWYLVPEYTYLEKPLDTAQDS